MNKGTIYYSSRKGFKFSAYYGKNRSEKLHIYGGYILEINLNEMTMVVKNGFNTSQIHRFSTYYKDKIPVTKRTLDALDKLLTKGDIYKKNKGYNE